MKEFFRGWRRKVGVVTLIMAGWVRSPIVEDSIEVPTGRHSTISLVSAYSQLLLKVEFRRFDDYTVSIPTWRSMTLWDGIKWYDDPPTVFHWEWNGFALAEVPYEELLDDAWQDYRSTYYFAPHWSVVAPLALISFWLLLSKSRQSTQNKNDELIQDEKGGATS